MIRIFFLILLFLSGEAGAQNAAGPGDYAIAGTVKTLARIFVETSDLDKVRARQIKALSKMQEAKFQKRYAETYSVLKDLPPALLARYGLTAHMTRQEAINKIRRINKDDLAAMIDEIPDQAIVKRLKDCLQQQADQWKGKTFLQQIASLWKKFIQKA